MNLANEFEASETHNLELTIYHGSSWQVYFRQRLQPRSHVFERQMGASLISLDFRQHRYVYSAVLQALD